jgi:hypothetical protein
MSEAYEEPRSRPADPAGTRPKVDPASLESVPLIEPVIDADAEEITAEEGGEELASAGGGAAAAPVTPVASTSLSVAESLGGGGLARPRAAAEAPHAPRFQFILGALIALGLSAVALTAGLLFSNRDTLPPAWSAWHPTGPGFAAATQIGNHISAEYRLASGHQMLAVSGGPLAVAGVPVTVALRNDTTGSGNVSIVDGNGVLFKMCGLGPSCSIEGKPTAERLMLVRREALELALYTFEYIGGVNQVVVFLPPVTTASPSASGKTKLTHESRNAVFFRARDLVPELERPLSDTLTRSAPAVASVRSAPDAPLVDKLTTQSFYRFSFVQTGQDASVFLVLQPFTLSGQ